VVQVKAQRDSEPLPENLSELCKAVTQQGCDLGMALDLDADRLALVDENGEPPGEDYTLVLVVDQVLRRRNEPAVVVKNLTTTRAVDEVAARYQARVVETRVGEINLSRALRDNLQQGRFAFGGEGNGGVIYPAISLGRDSLMGSALVLEALAVRDLSLSALLDTLPRYHAAKDKLDLGGDLEALYRKLEGAFPEAQVNRMDGLRLFFGDGSWVAVRPSNTEPVVRVLAESPNPAWPQEALKRVRQLS
jgi:phosphomannomutase